MEKAPIQGKSSGKSGIYGAKKLFGCYVIITFVYIKRKGHHNGYFRLDTNLNIFIKLN